MVLEQYQSPNYRTPWTNKQLASVIIISLTINPPNLTNLSVLQNIHKIYNYIKYISLHWLSHNNLIKNRYHNKPIPKIIDYHHYKHTIAIIVNYSIKF
jgi:hypothetical protein